MPKRKIKVFVDAEVLVAPHFSGIGHYTLELLRALDRQLDHRDDIQVTLGVFFRRINTVREMGFRNFKIRRFPLPLRITNGLKIRGRQFPIDLLYGKKIYMFPNYTSWPVAFSKIITIVYDLSFEYHPKYVEPRNQKFLSSQVKKSVERSSAIITISKNSQREICEFYKVKKSKVPIIYPGIDQSEFYRRSDEQINRVKARYGIYGKYILFVGNIEPRKNIVGILLAYEKLPKTMRNEYSLLLVGARGWLDNEIFEIIERLRVNGNHIQQPTDYVEDADRAALYSGASLFVYPSRYEGFGIPPVEAMACGTPTVASNNSSLPEAVGEGAIQVDAENTDQISTAMEMVLKDKKLQESLRVKGFSQADKFSWDREAKKLVGTLESLVE